MSKVYDLESRTFKFAHDCRKFCRNVSKDISNKEDAKQLVRSSGSVAANYIEANESLSKKDFAFRIKICRKEAKECILWLRLIETRDLDLQALQKELIVEAGELVKIFSSIVVKSTPKADITNR